MGACVILRLGTGRVTPLPAPLTQEETDMVLLEFSMYPLDKGESLSPYVARSMEIIEESGLDYRMNAMGTILEGEWDQVFEVVKRCFERMKQDCRRIAAVIKVDYRQDRRGGLEAKVRSVEEKAGREFRK